MQTETDAVTGIQTETDAITTTKNKDNNFLSQSGTVFVTNRAVTES